MTTAHYEKPAKRVHRGFYYLDDETVINSLSAVEAGKVDEVVAKINTARGGGFGGALGIQGAKVEGSKKTESSFEEEMVRTRTRFSVFEIWYQNLISSKGLGRFSGWGTDVLTDIQPGDTIEFRARLEVVPLLVLLRLYLWFVEQAKSQNSVFSVKGDELKMAKEGERNIRMLLGNAESEELVVIGKPEGNSGPPVVLPLSTRWMIGKLGHLSGYYSVVAQVDQVVTDEEELPTLRVTREVPPTPVELVAIREVVQNFVEPAKALGITVSTDDAGVKGPALWVTPIAIFR